MTQPDTRIDPREIPYAAVRAMFPAMQRAFKSPEQRARIVRECLSEAIAIATSRKQES